MEPPEEGPRKRKVEEPKGEGAIAQVASRDAKRARGEVEKEGQLLVRKDEPSTMGKPYPVTTNFSPIRTDERALEKIFVHHMHLEPAGGVFIKQRVLWANKDRIGSFEFWGELLFAEQDLSHQTFKAEVNATEYVVTLSERIPPVTIATSPERMAMFSRLLRTVFAKWGFIRIRDSIYDPTKPISLYDMKAFPGYSTNVDHFHGGLMLNSDISYKWVQTKSVLEMLMGLQHDRTKQTQLVANQSVITSYTDRRGDYRHYRVSAIDYDKTPNSTFPRRKRREHKYAEAEEELISYYDYYRETHNITIRYRDQPLLKVVERRRVEGVRVEEVIYLVPELCVLAGMTEEMRTNGQVRREVMKVTGVGPADRVNRVRALLDKVRPGQQIPHRARPGEMIDPGAGLTKLGMYVEKELYAVEGRLLPPPALRIGLRTPVPLVEGQGEWRDLYGKPPRRGAPPETSSPGLFRPQPLNAMNWALFYTERQESDVKSMMEAFQTVKAQLKMEIGDPLMCVTRRVQDYPAEMARVYEKSVHEGRKIKMFQVVLESSSEAVYKSIKAVMTSKPIQTQCVQQRTIKPTGGIESKMKGLLQQMVCKLGGAPWALDEPPLMEKPTMVMGISVSHSKAGQHSVLALTATLDVGLTRYFSDVCFQAPGQTLASGVAESFDKALRAFASTNPNLPVERIIVYRDDPGGRGALGALMENEIKPMEAILRQRSSQANLAVVVVRKRGLVRLFTSSGNPLPGTMVDVGIVSREFNDFYLIAHSARIGTVKPTQYQIVYRTGKDDAFKAPNIQHVSYLLCHLYYNFMGAIAEPAPLRYADRLAGLTRQVLDNKGLPRAELSNTLFHL